MYIQEGIRKLRWEGRRGGRREGEELDLSPLEFFTGRNKKKEKKKAATLTGRNYFFGDNLNIPTVWNAKRKKSG